MNRSYIMAVLLALGAAAWIASGQFADGGNAPPALKPPADLAAADQVPPVRVRAQTAELRVNRAIVRGRTEAVRTVEVRAETEGRVVEVAVERGDRVVAGQVIARLASEDRPARLKEARALLEQRRLEHEAARRLSKKGFRSETQLAAASAALGTAEAAVDRAEVELDNIQLRAPFDGIVDDRMSDIGDFLKVGDHVARVVDLDPILVVGQVSEREVGGLEVGRSGSARLITGQELSGRLRFVGAMADATTRTFRAELEVANPEGKIPDGITAEIEIPLDQAMAHLVSPAILTLADDGVIGVKTLEAGDTVGFHPVTILESGLEGVWIGGLPEQVTFITVGQEFVTVGQKVKPVQEGSLEQDGGPEQIVDKGAPS